MSVKLTDLQPDVQAKAQLAIEALKSYEIPCVVTSTLRTTDEQRALFSQGRDPIATVNRLRSLAGMRPISDAENTYTVTNADGVNYKSNHQGGRALDIVPTDTYGNPIWPPISDPRWSKISLVMKSFGFAWGGDWPRFPDYPHYEMV